MVELERLSDAELEDLRALLHRLLIQSDANTPERRNILASLENIDRVHNRSCTARAPFP